MTYLCLSVQPKTYLPEERSMFIHCPNCNSVANVPIAYGKPGSEMMEAHKYGLIHIAGCVIEDERIDRHCKACGYEWASDTGGALPHDDHFKQMVIMLDELAAEHREHQNILEHTSMDMGRRSIHGDEPLFENLIHTIHRHNEAWRDFTYRLHQFRGKVQIKDPKGSIQAEYDTGTAHIYIKKNLWFFYSQLGRLALGCYRLGNVTTDGTVDNIKVATHEVQQTREELERLWQEMRNAALHYGSQNHL